MTDWVSTILPAKSFSAGVWSLLESKHLVICKSEVLGACEERALLSWWELIGVAETAATRNCVCIIQYPQVIPTTKHGSIVAITNDAIHFLSSDERQFGWSQATWIHQAKQKSLATVYITWK